MQFFTYTLLLAAVQGSLGAILGRTGNTGCNANKCARAVTGTRSKDPDMASRTELCSSFMRTTIGPGTTIVPTKIPAYATACTNSAAYSSACSCWGVTPTTVPTYPCNNPGTCGTFVIVNDASCGPLSVCVCATDADGRSVCVQDQYCSAPTCETDSDCGLGGICWASNCCGVNICTVPGTVCANPARVLAPRKREANGGNCTGAYCEEAKRG